MSCICKCSDNKKGGIIVLRLNHTAQIVYPVRHIPNRKRSETKEVGTLLVELLLNTGSPMKMNKHHLTPYMGQYEYKQIYVYECFNMYMYGM